MIDIAIVVGLIILNIKLKKVGVFYLQLGFYFFCGGSVISIVGLESLAEFIMRVSLLCLFMGFLLIFKESAL